MVVIYLLSLFIADCVCFNVDVENVVNIKGPEKSHFGYSALMFINDANEKWVVVGAPKANFTTQNPYKSPGNVYNCRLNLTSPKQEQCTAMNLEQGDTFRWPDSPGYEEDNELLGATMTLIDDTVVICAPLWKNYIPWTHDHIAYTFGRCFDVNKNMLSSYSSRPFKTNPLKAATNWTSSESQFIFEFAQIGFSMSSKKYQHPLHHVLLGAPGFFENAGGFVQYNEKSTDADIDLINTFVGNPFGYAKNQAQQGNLAGYSITTGNVVNNSDCLNVVAVGAPHFKTVHGISGSSGGGFGTSLVFEDFNNDGLDDLLVGEPLYFDSKTNVLDVGAVHIYYGINDSSVILEESGQVLSGSGKENGRFGTAMEFIGDLNKDNYNDIVIAAPYEDELKGSIYIYHGGEYTLTLAQKITPENFGMDLQSFGWYISAAYDIDENLYPDFVVGSYMSDSVSLFRTRPIVILYSTIDTIPKVIPLNSTDLLCQDKYFRPCVSVKLCFSYTGESVPSKIRMYYNMSTDIERTRGIPMKDSRVGLQGSARGNESFIEGFVEVTKENGGCVIHYTTVQAMNRDFYASLGEPLVFESGFELSDMPMTGDVQPILQMNTQTFRQVSANFSSGCNDTCRPDLHIDIKQDAEVVFLGEVSDIVLKVQLSNTGDQAYGTQLLVDFSNNTKFINFSQPQDEATLLISCKEITDEDNKTGIECNTKSNTFYPHQKVDIVMRFAVNRLLLVAENQTLENFNQDIKIQFEVQSTAVDDNIGDNIDTVHVKVKLKSSVEFSGMSNPDQLWGDKGIVFTHSYSIFNYGPSPLNDYKINICLPVIREDDTILISKDDIKVKTSHKELFWSLAHFPEKNGLTSTAYITRSIEGTTPLEWEITSTEDITKATTSSLDNDETSATTSIIDTSSYNTIQHSTSVMPVTEQKIKESRGKLTFNVITCEGKPQERFAILEFTVSILEKNTGAFFELPFNLSESALDFDEVSGVIFRARGESTTRNDDRYYTTSYNATNDDLYISTEIYGQQTVAVVIQKISIWIIIGASVGGFVLLILFGVILKKCGFFERKKREDVKKWKRQSGYYADRQSRVSMISAKVKSVNWETLNNDFSTFGKREKEKKMVTIKE